MGGAAVVFLMSIAVLVVVKRKRKQKADNASAKKNEAFEESDIINLGEVQLDDSTCDAHGSSGKGVRHHYLLMSKPIANNIHADPLA